MDENEMKAVDPARRGFLRAAGGAGALGALAALAGQGPATTAGAPAAAPAASAPSGYHETEHIRKYYRTARYW
jgi:nitrous oxide reductase